MLGPGIAFRKPKDQTDPSKGYFQNRINGSIYESQMVAFSRAFEQGKRKILQLRHLVCLKMKAIGKPYSKGLQKRTRH